MRTLLPASDSGDSPSATDVHAHYAQDWLERGGVRVNFVSSIDGGSSAAGKSKGLQTPGDNTVFAALRDLADVIVVGAGTARAEGYRPATPPVDRQQRRQQLGLGAAPAVAVVSASLNIDLSAELYSGTTSLAPTLIVSGSAAPVGKRNDIIDLAASGATLQLIEAPAASGGGVDFTAAVASLRELGYRRILCEGGPSLFSTAVLSRSVDELCLSVSPMLVGPAAGRIVAGPDWPEDFLPQLRLVGLLIEDDALFCRYLVQR